MKRLTVILLVIITIILPISSMAFEYIYDEETGLKLYELPNGVKDEIIEGKFIQRTYEHLVLGVDGTWNSFSYQSGTERYIYIYSSVNFSPSINPSVDILQIYFNNENISIIGRGATGSIVFSISKYILDDYSGKGDGLSKDIDFRNYIDSQSPLLIYQLETPVEINIEPIKGHHKVKLLVNEFSIHVKNIAVAISKTITEFFYDGEAITARGILFFAYVAVVFCLSILAIVFKRR